MKQKRHSQPIIDSSLHVSRPHRSSLFLIRFTQYSCLIPLLPSAFCTAIMRPARQSCALHSNHAPCAAIMRSARQSCALHGNHAPCTAIMRPAQQSCALRGNHAPLHPTIHLADSLRDCPKTTQPYTWQIPSGIAPKPPTIPAADSLRDCPTPPLADSHRDCPSHTWPPGRFPPGLPQPHHSRFPPGLL
jgi:hypothetical protein